MIRALIVVTIGILLGIGAGEYLTSNFSVRRWIGEVVRRGDLQILVGHRGIYDTDVARAWQSELFATGANPQEIEASIAAGQKRAALGRLVKEQKLNLGPRVSRSIHDQRGGKWNCCGRSSRTR
ncbi:MAG TPA: hypothetical protein VLI42_05625, partial [Chthoniobacterales bacterium]|nr:hypothetical protein [Chthoniobacterales bacterium]